MHWEVHSWIIPAGCLSSLLPDYWPTLTGLERGLVSVTARARLRSRLFSTLKYTFSNVTQSFHNVTDWFTDLTETCVAICLNFSYITKLFCDSLVVPLNTAFFIFQYHSKFAQHHWQILSESENTKNTHRSGHCELELPCYWWRWHCCWGAPGPDVGAESGGCVELHSQSLEGKHRRTIY